MNRIPWDESKHPRNRKGLFAIKAGSRMSYDTRAAISDIKVKTRVPVKVIQKYLHDRIDGPIWGLYDQNKKLVYIQEGLSFRDARATILHEVGHHIHWTDPKTTARLFKKFKLGKYKHPIDASERQNERLAELFARSKKRL